MTDELSQSPNPHRLQRNKQRGMIGGVVAGLADYFSVDVAILRIAAVMLVLFPGTLGFMILGYVIAWIVIPARAEQTRHTSPEEDNFWRGVSHRPDVTFSNLRYTFRDLEDRLRSVEQVVTSEEWRLRREFRDLERS